MVVPETIKKGSLERYHILEDHIIKTPLYHFGKNTWIKAENLQNTGSFKLRGAVSKLWTLYQQGVFDIVTASTGNHGLAVAYMAEKLGMSARVFVPQDITDFKEKKLIQYPVELVKVPGDSSNSERIAREFGAENSIPYISPYNDVDIIIGQGTIGYELSQQVDLNEIDRIYITVGGGGLISGIASYLKLTFPNVEIIGCQPRNSPVMYESIKAGKVVDYKSQSTLSDGSAGGMDIDTITLDLCAELVDRYVLASEIEIRKSIKEACFKHNMVIEGAAAVAQSCMSKDAKGSNSIAVWCGGNIDPYTWKEVVFSE